MLKKLIIWLKGYIILSISGKNTDRFLNLCIKNNLDIWKIYDKNDCKCLHISKKSFNELETYIKKTNVNIEIINKIGLPFVFYRYKKRKIFILGIIFFMAVIYSFSFYIWDINITGEEIYTDEQIIKKLEEYNIKHGTKIKKIDCEKLEKMLRKDYSDIAWISCEIKGTRLNINLKETIAPEDIKENKSPCNIIAVKDGIISDIFIESGTRVKDKGDEVKKGDILITGAVNLYNDYDELIETSYVPANGNVYAVVKYEYDDSFELDYYEKEYTGDKKTDYGLYLAGNCLNPFRPEIKYNNYDIVSIDKKIKIGSYFYLPFSLKKSCIKEYKPVLKKYDEKEARNKARVKLNAYIDELNKKGVEILENNVKIEIDENKCRAYGEIITNELIGVPADITIINQGEDNTDGIY